MLYISTIAYHGYPQYPVSYIPIFNLDRLLFIDLVHPLCAIHDPTNETKSTFARRKDTVFDWSLS